MFTSTEQGNSSRLLVQSDYRLCQHPINQSWKCVVPIVQHLDLYCALHISKTNNKWHNKKSDDLAVRNGSLSLYHCLWMKDITPGLLNHHSSHISLNQSSLSLITRGCSSPSIGVWQLYARWDRTRRSTSSGKGRRQSTLAAHLTSPISYPFSYQGLCTETGWHRGRGTEQESIKMRERQRKREGDRAGSRYKRHKWSLRTPGQ